MRKKGFTLIELLAVIVILGVILVIAIPSINAIILNSRKNAYVTTANEFAEGLESMSLINLSLLPIEGTQTCRQLKDIKLEKGSNVKSPFGKEYTSDSKVCIMYDVFNKDYIYSICLVDVAGNGFNIDNIINLTKKHVQIGTAKCESADYSNEDNDGSDSGEPDEAVSLDIKQIEVGVNFSMLLLENGEVWEWGHNFYGQLGDGTTTNKFSPVKVPGLTDIKQIAAGNYHVVALKENGKVWTWGG